MAISEAEQLLVSKLGLNFPINEGMELFTELESLPLAITQAAAYMLKRKQTVSQYLELYRHSNYNKMKLLSHNITGHARETRASESVMTTWFISFEHIKSENPGAADLLCLMSFLDRNGIPKALLPVREFPSSPRAPFHYRSLLSLLVLEKFQV